MYLSESGRKKGREVREGPYVWEKIDVVLNSPKLQKKFMYFNVTLPRDLYDSVVYDNKDIEMIVH